jgi:hypothetical protein
MHDKEVRYEHFQKAFRQKEEKDERGEAARVLV